MYDKSMFVFCLTLIGVYLYFIFNNFFGIDFSDVWFSLGLVFISLPLFCRSIYFKSDSSLWASSLLIWCGIAGIYKNAYFVDMSLFYPIYIFSLSFASFIVYVFFRQKIHFKLFALILLEVIILLSYKLNYLPKHIFLLVNIAYLSALALWFIVRFLLNTRRV